MPDLPALTIPSLPLHDVWQPIWAAHDDNKELPSFRQITIEWHHGQGIRLICTNRQVLLAGWLPLDPDDTEPHISELPDDTTTVVDTGQRGLGLIKYAAACAKADKDEDGRWHNTTIEVRPARSSRNTPALAEALEQHVLAVRYEGETVELPVAEIPAFDWRSTLTSRLGAGTVDVCLSAPVLEVLAKTGQNFRMNFTGDNQAVLITTRSGVPIRGAAMPMYADEAAASEAA